LKYAPKANPTKTYSQDARKSGLERLDSIFAALEYELSRTETVSEFMGYEGVDNN
jgi:hypothetical protein